MILATDKTSCFSRQRISMSSAPCWTEVTCTWVSHHHDQRMAASHVQPTDGSLDWRKGGQEAVPLPSCVTLGMEGQMGMLSPGEMEQWGDREGKKKNHTAKALFDVCFTCPLERSCVLAGTLRAGVCSCSTAVKPGPRSGKRQTYSQALVEFCSWGRALNYQQAQINSGVTDCTAVPL